MKVVIITSAQYGTSAHLLSALLRDKCCEIELVIFSNAVVKKNKKYYLSKLKKARKIGFLGVINGLRIRSWYKKDVNVFLEQKSIKEVCEQNSVNYCEVSSVNSPETASLLGPIGADLGLSLSNSYISPRIFDIPKYGMINIHHELLPEYQNAQSIIWAIFNGSIYSGYTIHKINRQIDKGEILSKTRFRINFKNTLKQTVVYNTAFSIQISSEGLIKVLRDFENIFNNAAPQTAGNSYTTPSIWQFLRMLLRHKRLRYKQQGNFFEDVSQKAPN